MATPPRPVSAKHRTAALARAASLSPCHAACAPWRHGDGPRTLAARHMPAARMALRTRIAAAAKRGAANVDMAGRQIGVRRHVGASRGKDGSGGARSELLALAIQRQQRPEQARDGGHRNARMGKARFDLFAAAFAGQAPGAEVFAVVGKQPVVVLTEAGPGAGYRFKAHI